MQSMYPQYDFILNMVQFHPGRSQCEICTVSSVFIRNLNMLQVHTGRFHFDINIIIFSQ